MLSMYVSYIKNRCDDDEGMYSEPYQASKVERFAKNRL